MPIPRASLPSNLSEPSFDYEAGADQPKQVRLPKKMKLLWRTDFFDVRDFAIGFLI